MNSKNIEIFTKRWLILMLLMIMGSMSSYAQTQPRAMERSYIRGGVLDKTTPAKLTDSLTLSDVAKTLSVEKENKPLTRADSAKLRRAERSKFFSDSMSLSQVCWSAAVLPGYGQIYNKQYWKLPILYSTLAGGIAMFLHENKSYKPLKAEYDELILADRMRSEELNDVQNKMVRSNTRRQLYLGAAVASYIYLLGDAAVNYATNDVSGVKRATTLATICPGAGQIYNKSYWKLPFVVGGFASMIYVVDWNNRGYKRFKTAYQQLSAYEADPDAFPNGYPDEFNGRYSTDDLKNLREQYRRNRDYSIILLAGLYVLQIVDAHVDAHFKDFDISDDLAMDIKPAFGYQYSPQINRNSATYGFDLGIKF